MTEDIDDFDHDPTDSEEIPPSAPTSFEEAQKPVDEGAADGAGFVVTRHDPFLVMEISNCLSEQQELLDPIGDILDALGSTFTELEGEDSIRLMYRGQLPGDLHGGGPIVFSMDTADSRFGVRLYDSGWTPMTGQHVKGTPEDVEEIDEQALHRLLERVEAFDE